MVTNASGHPLLRLQPPSEIPRPPISTASKYTIDANERLVRADFSRDRSWLELDPVDEAYLLRLFERPDITVIIKGLAKCLTPHLWDVRYLNERCGTIMHHNFKCFSKAEGHPRGQFNVDPEIEKPWCSMKVSDYVRYLDKRAAAVKRAASRASAAAAEYDGIVEDGGGSSMRTKRHDVGKTGAHEKTMVFTSFDGKPRTVKLLEESVSLIDMDLSRYLPECAKELDRKFMLDILPGGSKDALMYTPQESRPFLGPNLSITLPGSRTHFLEGGDGTVDGGHQCLTGKKRVIMLRRLNNADKKRAMKLLAGDLSCHEDEGVGGRIENPRCKIPWPSEAVIDLLKELNYCPSVFTLEPGEFVHINKGRLHAFRKEEPLPYEDPASVCVSVAWNWVFPGVTEAGCKEELGYALQCAEHNRRAKSRSIAPLETCLVQAAKSALAILRVRSLSQAPISCPTQPPSTRVVASYAAPASASSDKSGAVSTASDGSGAAESNGSSNGSHANENTNGSSNGHTKGSSNGHINGSSRRSPVFEMYLRLKDVMSCDAMQAEKKLNSECPMSLGGGVGGRGAMKIRKIVGNGVGVEGDDSNRSGARGSPTIPAVPSRNDLAATGKGRSTLSLPSLLLLPPPPAQSQPPVGLGNLISGSSTSPEASAVGPIPARSLDPEAAAAFSALEELKNGVKAADDATVAPCSLDKCGESYAVSTSGSFSSSSSAAGRSAVAGGGDFLSSSVISQQEMDGVRVTGSGIEKKARDSDGAVEEGEKAGEVGKLSDVDMLSALAPLLQEIVGRQRREWDMQCQAKEGSKKLPKINPPRSGKRKLGPAAAKARDEAIAAVIQMMEKPIKQAVDRVEVDSSIPRHLQKVDPFSGGEGFSCASCGCELFNAYMHCFGCDTLLNKNMNLCLGCHATGRLSFPSPGQDEVGLTNRRHCPNVPKATLLQRKLIAEGHRSNPGNRIANRCPCLEDTCTVCHLCVACACDCHRRFQLRFRFEHPAHLERLVMEVRDTASGGSPIPLNLGSQNIVSGREKKRPKRISSGSHEKG